MKSITGHGGKYKEILSNGKFLINADTFGQGYRGIMFSRLRYYYDNILDYNLKSRTLTKVIPNIDLGLYRREMPDLELKQDIYKADIKVNGKTYTYMYNSKLKISEEETEEESKALQVDFNEDYRLPIYEADANYADYSPENGLEATITYKIALENLSNNLYAEIKSIDDYYTNKVITNNKGQSGTIGLEVDKDGDNFAIYLSDNIAENTFDDTNRVKSFTIGKATVPNPDGYKAHKINFTEPIKLSNMIHSAGETNKKYLYIRFRIVNVKQCYYLFTTEKEWEDYVDGIANKITSFENFAEIGTYSIYSSKTFDQSSLYAAVDKTSRPTNFNPTRFAETDEDDSDKAPGLNIIAVKPREISGIVFEDMPVKKFTTNKGVGREVIPADQNSVELGQERIGNGFYDNSTGNPMPYTNNNLGGEFDKTVEGIKVKLVDKKGDNVPIWNSTERKWEDVYEIKSLNDGTYSIQNFSPGDYKIEFVWGKEYGKKDVKEYKSTIYTNTNFDVTEEGNINTNPAGNLWIYTMDINRHSDAVDNYYRRLAIDKKALGLEFTDTKDDDVTPLYSDDEQEKIEAEEKNNLEEMISSTAEFVIGVERGAGENGITTPDQRERLKSTSRFANGLGLYSVSNIDFGLVERPRQAMGVEKHIKSISIKTSDGRPVVIATIGVDGKVNTIAGDSYISGGFNLGYLYAQLDKNLQGDMEVKIEYSIEVKNYSEKDFDDWKYYYLGNESTNIVKLNNRYLYDYLDGSNINSDDGKWETADTNKDKYIKINSDMSLTVMEEEFKEMKASKVNTEEEIEEYINNNFEFTNYEASKKRYKELFVKWNTELNDITDTNVRKNKLANKIILKGTELNELTNAPYEPGETKKETIVCSKILANGDNIQFNNEVEMATVSVNKNVRSARRVNTRTAPLYDLAEYVTISPATGENRDYLGLTIVSIGILTVFGTCIVLIKRFLKRQ